MCFFFICLNQSSTVPDKIQKKNPYLDTLYAVLSPQELNWKCPEGDGGYKFDLYIYAKNHVVETQGMPAKSIH